MVSVIEPSLSLPALALVDLQCCWSAGSGVWELCSEELGKG